MTNDKRGLALGFCLAVLKPIVTVATKREWRGQENVPKTGGCIIAVNHVSEVDPLTIGHFVYGSGRYPRFLGKAEVFKVPVLGRLLRSAGQIPVYRHSSDAAKAYRAALEALYDGRCLIFYPEGTLTRQPDLWPMVGKTGAARLAMSSGYPLIPVAQWGPQELLAPYGRRPHLLPRKVMRISAGAPIDFGDLSEQPITPESLRIATNRVMDAITSLLEEIRGERAPGTRFDPKSAAKSTDPTDRSNPEKP